MKCEERYNKSKMVHSIMRHVAEKTNTPLEELYTDIGISDLQAQLAADAKKGILKRTMEVMNSVVRAEEQVQEREQRLKDELEHKQKQRPPGDRGKQP